MEENATQHPKFGISFHVTAVPDNLFNFVRFDSSNKIYKFFLAPDLRSATV